MKNKQILIFAFLTVLLIPNLQSQSYQYVWDEVMPGSLMGYADCDSDSNIELVFRYNAANNWEDYFYIVDGVSGNIEYTTQPGWFKNINAIVLIDVNGDGRSEILMQYSGSNAGKTALYAYGSLGVNEKGEEENGFYSSNFPNPFNTSTTIEYAVETDFSNVIINIYDQMGNLVVSIDEGKKERGDHQVIWNGRDNRGIQVDSGSYLYNINMDEKTGSSIMIKL